MTICKFCGSESLAKKGFVSGQQFYECKDCHHRFVDNGCFAGMKTKDRIVSTGISLYFDGCSLRNVKKQIAEIYGVRVSQVTVLNWIRKYSELVDNFVSTLTPFLSGKYHHDETEINVLAQRKYFWETIDEDTRYVVASLLTHERTTKDAKAVFRQALKKQRPIAFFTDGSYAYEHAFSGVFFSHFKANKVEWVRRVGLKARETNNVVERLHGTLKDRLKPMRGLKEMESSASILKGHIVNYNYVRGHTALKGKTPAQQAGIKPELSNWYALINAAQKHEVSQEKQVLPIEVKSA